jgi:hypothetical protein
MTIKLPDVSEFQTGGSAPDWAGIKAMNGGAGIIRVGYGDAHLDHMFVANYTALKKNGYRFMGLYHYLVAGQDVPSQAAKFCEWVGPKSAVAPGTVFILDLEEGAGNQATRANQWLDMVDAHYGLNSQPLNKRSWLYSYTSFVTSHSLSAIFASTRHTWIAAYQTITPSIGHTLWQSTDGKSGSNITNWPGCGRCDTSVHAGTLGTLAADAWGAADTPPVKPPVTPPAFHGEWVSAGMLSLHDLAAQFGLTVASLVRMTAVHYTTFDPGMATYLNGVHDGTLPPTAKLPKGTKVWVN